MNRYAIGTALLLAQAAAYAGSSNDQPWFMPAYRHALHAPFPAKPSSTAVPPVLPQFHLFPNPWGVGGNYIATGPVKTAENAFFKPFGNGRSCLTCHQPANSMSITPAFARAVFAASRGQDPLFAPVDGANCPNRVPAANTAAARVGGRLGAANSTNLRAAYSLLLDRGLFRIFLPVPKVTTGLDPAPVEFTLELVSDPNGCNTDPAYNQEVDPQTGEVTQIISVYRRPLMTSSLKFKTAALANTDPRVRPVNLDTGEPLPVDPLTGLYANLNIMWDGRDIFLQDQAVNAVLIHAQGSEPPTQEEVLQMLAFQNNVFNAQETLKQVKLSNGANGGSKYLATRSPLQELRIVLPFNEYDAWSTLTPTTPKEELQASIARGQIVFNEFPLPFRIGRIVGDSCTTCHGQQAGGSELTVPGNRNTGVGGQSVALNGPAPDPALPIFKLTCREGVRPSPDGLVVMTNDPGRALVTGRCADIGSFTTPTIRGLAARAPYFHDGSAATVMDIVNFYDKRFTAGFTEQQKQDLVNFLSSL